MKMAIRRTGVARIAAHMRAVRPSPSGMSIVACPHHAKTRGLVSQSQGPSQDTGLTASQRQRAPCSVS